MSLVGASVFYISMITVIALVTINDVDQFTWAVWLNGILFLFYGCIVSIFWEFVFHMTYFKTLWRGGLLYFLLGALCGGIAVGMIHYTIGEIHLMGWMNAVILVIGSMSIMGVGAVIFYLIRRIPHKYS